MIPAMHPVAAPSPEHSGVSGADGAIAPGANEPSASGIAGGATNAAPRVRLVAQSRHGAPGILPALQALISLVVIALFVITFSVQPFRIPSSSMEPTLMVGDFLLVDKHGPPTGEVFPGPPVHRGEVIVFHYPVDPSIHLVKRVIGIPGDRIRLRQGKVYLNGKAITESYAVYRDGPPDNFRDNFPRLQTADPEIDARWWVRMHTMTENGDLIIPENNYFVLGDNRNDSEDSRYWGFVPAESIVGRPLLIYFSLQETGPGLSHAARWNRTLQIVR